MTSRIIPPLWIRTFFATLLLGGVSLVSFTTPDAHADGFPEDMSSGSDEMAVGGASTDAPAAKKSMADTKAEPSTTEQSKEDSGTEAQEPGENAYTGPKLDSFDLARYQYCGSDEDCVVALNGCCDCENGGQEVAINKDRLDAFKANFACDTVACGDALTSNRCGAGVVSCVEHSCKYFAEEEGI